jgi:hypothetical protein
MLYQWKKTRKTSVAMSTFNKEVQKRYQLDMTRYQKQIARVKKILRKSKAAA